MKKLFILILLIPMLVGCSSNNSAKKKTIQMNDVKWTFWGEVPGDVVRKQTTMFDLVPGPQQFIVTTYKEAGETWYICELELNVKLNRSVDIDLSKILADKNSIRDAKACAGIYAVLLDRNGERIKVGRYDADLILFNPYNEEADEHFVDYLTFLQSDPGTVFTLRFYMSYNEEDECSVGFPNLINEVKGCDLEVPGGDKAFEEHVGVIW